MAILASGRQSAVGRWRGALPTFVLMTLFALGLALPAAGREGQTGPPPSTIATFSGVPRSTVLAWLNANAQVGKQAVCFNGSVGHFDMRYVFSLNANVLTLHTKLHYKEIYRSGLTEQPAPQSYIDRFSLDEIDGIHINRIADCSSTSPPSSFHWSLVFVCKMSGCINKRGETLAPKDVLEIAFPADASPHAVRDALMQLLRGP